MRLYEVKGFFIRKGYSRLHIVRNFFGVFDESGIGEPMEYKGVTSMCWDVAFHKDKPIILVKESDVFMYKLCRKCKNAIRGY